MLKGTRCHEETTMDIGAQLQAAREARGLSIGTLAQRTRVQARTLAAIELNDLSSIPPRPFGRGFVRVYAEEVALDPDRTVRDYFAQFPSVSNSNAASPTRSREAQEPSLDLSSQWAGLATAVAILLLVVAAAVVFGRRGESARESDAVGTTGASPAAPGPTDSRAPASQPTITQPVEAAPPTAPTPAAPLSLVFSVDRPCWVTASADGRRTIYRTLQPGDREALNAQREILIRFGDAGAVTWSINGRHGGPLGAAAAIRDLRITPDNVVSVR